MLPLERQNRILEILAQKRAATVDELCSTLYSSGATIRRDLKMLETTGLIRRTHGGAVYIDSNTTDFPMPLRETENPEKKELLVRRALPLIRDGLTLFLDSSSTVCHLAKHLGGYQQLRVVTNSLKTANILAELDGPEVHCTGGRLRENAMSFVGTQAIHFVQQFSADYAFISCRGIHPQAGITDADENEAEIKRMYIQNAAETVLLCDSSKIGRRSFCRIAPLQDIRHIITDGVLPEEYTE